jgi:hypothetical protein
LLTLAAEAQLTAGQRKPTVATGWLLEVQLLAFACQPTDRVH